MKKNKFIRRLLSGALAAALTAGMCLTASAYGDFKYPNSYWPLQNEWVAAVEAKNSDQIIASAQKIYDALMPLLAVAIIYLTMVIIFTKFVEILERRLRSSDH